MATLSQHIRCLALAAGLGLTLGSTAWAQGDAAATDATFGPAQMINTPSGSLAVYQVGQGTKTLVFWPPLFGDHRFYRQQAQVLKTQARMVFIDGPAHGQSGPQTPGASVATHAESALAVMNQLKLTQAIFVGTSWGGLVGAQLARSQPQRLQGLVALNTPFAVDEANRPFALTMIVWGARWAGSREFFADGVADSYFAKNSLTQRSAAVAEFKANFANFKHSELAQVARTVLLERGNALPWLSSIQIPTVVVGGHEDANITPEQAQQAAALIPGGRYIDIPNTGHASAMEAPDRVNQIILDMVGAR